MAIPLIQQARIAAYILGRHLAGVKRYPLKAPALSRKGVDTEGAMAAEIPLEHQRPAEFMFETLLRRLEAEPSQREQRPGQRDDAA